MFWTFLAILKSKENIVASHLDEFFRMSFGHRQMMIRKWLLKTVLWWFGRGGADAPLCSFVINTQHLREWEGRGVAEAALQLCSFLLLLLSPIWNKRRSFFSLSLLTFFFSRQQFTALHDSARFFLLLNDCDKISILSNVSGPYWV